jgi:hypothetical protein
MTTIANFVTANQAGPSKPLLLPVGANAIQVDLAAGPTRELTEVKIGRFFVFGLLEDKKSWSLIRLSSILALRLQSDPQNPSSSVSWTRKAAGELIGSLNLPAPAVVGFREQPRNKVELLVLGASKALLATDSYLMPYVPFQAIGHLEISPI